MLEKAISICIQQAVIRALEHTRREAEHSSGGLSRTLAPANITLLRNGKLSTLALRQRDPGLGALANDEDVGDTDELVSEKGVRVSKATNRVAKVRSRVSLA
jgi:hypothetical protein